MVMLAISLSIVFLAAAVYITQQTFSRVNDTIGQLAEPDAKTAFLNEMYNTFGHFERNYQSHLLANPSASPKGYFGALDTLKFLVDSATTQYDFNPDEKLILDSIAGMIDIQNENLLKFRIMKQNQQPMLEKNLDSLINLINAERVVSQPDIVTTRKSTRRMPAETEETDEKEDEQRKKNFFQRIFSSNSDEEMPDIPPKKPEIIEETYIRIDTVPMAKSDTSQEKAGMLIKKIERKQARHQMRIRDLEMEILQLGARIQNYMLSLIRNSEEEELMRIHHESRIADNLMETAILRMYLVFGIFAVLAILFVVRILSDLARAKYYRRQLIEEKERAENLSKIKERFLANMSHEIRTPLQNISGYSERLANQSHNPDAKIIHQSSEHLLQIVNQVLDFSRISTGNLTLYPKDFSIQGLVDEVINSMKIQASAKNIRLLTETTLECETVFADPFRIRQILYNLLGNAIKFTETGFVKLYAETREQDNQVLFRFTVEDTGIGMDKAEINRLFEEFEQANTPNHATTGTGLGLSIVKSLVERYKGKINVDSDPGEGSRFDVELLLDHAKGEVEEQNVGAVNTKPDKVLLVDDDESILQLAHDILRDHGFSVTSTSSPLKAIEIVRESRFDIALVDFRMPEMTGAELSVALKELDPDLPVIAVTANVADPGESREFNGSFDGFLPKPFKAKDLLRLLGFEPGETTSHERNPALHEKLEQLTMQDSEAEAELIAQFKTDTLQDIHRLEKALKNSDGKEVSEVAHRLAGRLGFFEFKHLASVFHRVEKNLASGSLTDTDQKDLIRAVEALRRELSLLD